MVRKRFTGFIITVILLFLGLLFADPDSFPSFAGAIGIVYAAYLGGQSYTDGKNNGKS